MHSQHSVVKYVITHHRHSLQQEDKEPGHTAPAVPRTAGLTHREMGHMDGLVERNDYCNSTS